jgi:FAD synthetase
MRVMAFGTFDSLHPGHLYYLSQAGKFSNELIVVVARDQNVLLLKNRLPQENEEVRRERVESALRDLKLRGQAILGSRKNRWQLIKKFKPNVIYLGYDQKINIKMLKEFIASEHFFCEIKRIDAYQPEKYKSSLRRII